MSAPARCSVTELLVDECAHCRAPAPRPARPAFTGPGPTITARFRSRCPACGDTIEPGDLLVRVDGEWIHDDD